MKKVKKENPKKNYKPVEESEILKSRIGGNLYTEDDIVFIAQKFLTFGLNLQSISQVMKEQSIHDAFANNLQMQKELQKLFKEKEKLLDLKDCLDKINTTHKIQTVIKNPDVFQMSVLEKIK